MKRERVELLSPAGDLERLKIAVMYGADAVYIGGKQFSLRSRASNFGLTEIAEGVRFAKQYGARIHVTVNMLPHEADLEGLKSYLRELERIGVTAVIVASAAIMQIAKEVAPRLEVHVSTQHSTTNSSAIAYWEKKGMDRVVLARECSLDEIIATTKASNIPIEAFIHGAMCISYSGRCVLSNHMTDRDANRGGCAQSCRWKYRLYENGEAIHDEADPFSMSSKDMMACRYIPQLIEAGVASFKIEGRMKSVYYIATLVKTYRMLIDEYYEKGVISEERMAYYEKEFAKAENRPSGVGFYAGMPRAAGHLYEESRNPLIQEFIAYILDYDEKTQMAYIEVRNHFAVGAGAEVFGPNCLNRPCVISDLFDENKEALSVAKTPMQRLYMKIPFSVKRHDMIRRRRSI